MSICNYSFCFFFSSRRRHTRWPRDWSSDVCSSDLVERVKTINKTFIYQNKLPSLPIPPLSSTQAKLYEWIKPLVSKEQFEQTTNEIQQIGRASCRERE